MKFPGKALIVLIASPLTYFEWVIHWMDVPLALTVLASSTADCSRNTYLSTAESRIICMVLKNNIGMFVGQKQVSEESRFAFNRNFFGVVYSRG